MSAQGRPKSPLRVLVVGAGYFSPFQVQGWQRIAQGVCVGVVDPDTTRAHQLAGRFGIDAVFEDGCGNLLKPHQD